MTRTLRWCALGAMAACAQPTMPPGAPPDFDAPRLVRVSPDSGATGVRVRTVEFEFDEVVNEQGRSGTLDRLVLISPNDGDVIVSWHRSRLEVRPRRGWRDSTAYVVTLLPGIADLQSNVRDSTTVLVFATGDVIPATRMTGVVFDWGGGLHAPRALVQARPADDTTLVYTTVADSLGRFSLPFVRPGAYVLRGAIDGNRNGVIDPREAWDSVAVTLRDTVSAELYAFPHDSAGPTASSVTVVDSVTLRVQLDRPLGPGVVLDSVVALFAADSTPVAVARVVPWPALNDERTAASRRRADSIAAADTSEAGRRARERQMRDSVNRAATIADSVARDSTPRIPPPVPGRPRLVSDVGIVVAAPLTPGTPYRARLTLIGVLGAERVIERSFTRSNPTPDAGRVRSDTTSAGPSAISSRSPQVRD